MAGTDKLTPNGYKVTDWWKQTDDTVSLIKVEMFKFMQRRHELIEYHEHMWQQLERLEQIQVIIKNALEAKYE